MISGYKSLQVDIKNLKFETPDGRRVPQTAIVTFEVEGRAKPLVELMGYVDHEEIYRWIDDGEPVNLDSCYVNKLSLEDYRILRGLEGKKVVEICDFSARNALFDAPVPLDLTHARFTGTKFDISSAWILRGEWRFDSSVFETSTVDFSYVHFPDQPFDFKNVRVEGGEVTFKNAVFGTGLKDFQYTEFGEGNVDFTNVEFRDGDASFINAQFSSGITSFKVARFGEGRVDFHYACFKNGDISFERTEFGDGRVDFRTVEFGEGKVNFNRARFGNGEVTFEASEMTSGKFSFKRVLFGTGDLSFEEVVFNAIDTSFERTNFGSGNLSFYKASFGSLSFRFCHLDDYVDMRLHRCATIDLSNTIVRDIIDLNPHEFALQVEQIRFAGMRLIGRIYINWRRNGVKKLICGQQGESNRIKSEQFRILKENFNQTGQYADEDKSYVEFKRHEARADREEAVARNRFNALWSYPSYWFKLGLFDKAGLYATSPVRVLITMLTFFIVFSGIYLVLISTGAGDIIPSVDDRLGLVAKSFYHSAITFLTIGYGDHYPYGAIRWVSSIEGFAGLFLMSYFTVAFVRKILR